MINSGFLRPVLAFMTKDDFIKITNSLYQLTLLFPKKEPLRYRMREVADEILAKLSLVFKENPEKSTIVGKTEKSTIVEILENVEILNSFFEVAKAQNWVSPVEILNLQTEYSKLKKELEKSPVIGPIAETVEKSRPPKIYSGQTYVNQRQEKILAFLRENNRAQVWELKKIFPEVSKRTLRRDFEQLVRQGLIERKGERNATYYSLKIGQQDG